MAETEKCGFIDGWLQCDLEAGHAGLHQDHWLGGKPESTPEQPEGENRG